MILKITSKSSSVASRIIVYSVSSADDSSFSQSQAAPVAAALSRERRALLSRSGMPGPAQIAGCVGLSDGGLQRSGHGAPDPVELFQMQEVMPGIESNHMLDALDATLGMNSDALEIFA